MKKTTPGLDSEPTTLESKLQAEFPTVPPQFIKAIARLLCLLEYKNHDYTAGGDPFGNFRRVARIMTNYDDYPYDTPEGVAMFLLLKQFDAVMWALCKDIKPKVEGIEGRTDDVANYSLITGILSGERF